MSYLCITVAFKTVFLLFTAEKFSCIIIFTGQVCVTFWHLVSKVVQIGHIFFISVDLCSFSA